ncbi:MAG: hypothetical protein V1921_08030 [Candidatus Altiarchaeota archaeon]
MSDDSLLDAIIIACVFGIVLSFFMILAKDYIVKPEYFTELYFNKPGELPRHLELNRTYNFSYSIVNHERGPTNYLYYLRSDIKNITSNVTLLPGEAATFTILVRPEGLLWRVNSSINYSLSSSLAEVGGFFGLPANISLDSSISYYPLSFSLPGFGEVYHVNFSVDSLVQEPFSWHGDTYSLNNDSVSYSSVNLTFYGSAGRILVNSSRVEESSLTVADRFTVMLYGKENVIYFRYDVGY